MKDTEPLLLDTHVWYWLVTGHERLSGAANIRRLDRAAEAGELRLSIISIWEIAMLEAKGRLALGRRCESWMEEALEKSRVRVVPLDAAIAILSTRLDDFTHGDPADRILAATALDKGWRFMTADQKLIRYLEFKRMPVLAV